MTVLQALSGYYGRLERRGDVVSPGYSIEPIGVVLTIDTNGNLVDVASVYDSSGKKPKPESVPKWFNRQGTGSTPYFLWDNTAYALGVSNKDPEKTRRDHAAFKNLHLRELANESDPGLQALFRFLTKWTPDHFACPPFDKKMLALNIAFRLEGPEQELLHQRPAAIAHIERLRAATKAGEAKPCLVTGRILPVARLHPKIKGVDGAAAEAPLVSFNEEAYESYGQEKGDNAPTSEAAAFQYTAALNHLLDRAGRNRINIGDTTVAFWAEAEMGEEAASAAEDVFSLLVAPPDDESESAKLRDVLETVSAGRPSSKLHARLRPDTRFYVLGLAPSKGRIAVRFSLESTFERFAAALARHYVNLAIDPEPWGGKLPSIQRLLLRALVPPGTRKPFQYIDKNLSGLAGELARAVLSGASYPRTLLSAAIIRLRAGDNPGSGWHAAVIKAYLNRSEKEKLPVALDPNRKDTPYQLGRLFYVLESAQYAALGKVNAPIGDRYYASASATPARVFGPLLRGLKNHVSDARKRGKGGWIEPKVAEIMAMLPPELPRTLKLEEQGCFAIGYYHERATRPSKGEDGQGDEQTNESEAS